MKWETDVIEKPRERHALKVGLVEVTVSDDEKTGKAWKWFYLTFGRFDDRAPSDCLKDWPREAIASARAALDKFEAELGKGDDETSIQ